MGGGGGVHGVGIGQLNGRSRTSALGRSHSTVEVVFTYFLNLELKEAKWQMKEAAGKAGPWAGNGGQDKGTSRMLPFAAARMIVRKLKLRSNKEWFVWSKSGKRPSNIPAGPHDTYSDDGWISWPDWLGYTGVTQHKDMLPFVVARVIVRKLKLDGQKEWGDRKSVV